MNIELKVSVNRCRFANGVSSYVNRVTTEYRFMLTDTPIATKIRMIQIKNLHSELQKIF